MVPPRQLRTSGGVSAGAGYDPSAGWSLVWSEELAGTAIDPASWTFDIGSGGWGNDESESYRAENAAVADGLLTITAREEAFGDALYTSARPDVNATGGGHHRSWFGLTGVPIERFDDQRLEVVVTPISGATATMIYDGNDFDSVVTTPWSAAGP